MAETPFSTGGAGRPESQPEENVQPTAIGKLALCGLSFYIST